ncbi:MAG: alpha/beta hydrolase [Ferrimicrobium sp.]
MPLDADLAQYLSENNQLDPPSLREVPIEAARAARIAAVSHFDHGPTMALEEDITIPTATHLLRTRLYQPRHYRGGGGSGLIYLHGGGYILGSLDERDATCRTLADHAGILVFSVDYRLAPEHPFPAGIDDAECAFEYIHSKAKRFGLDPNRLQIGGDSAGATIALAVSLRAREAAKVLPASQLLIYPMADATKEYPSRSDFASGYGLSSDSIEYFYELYVPSRADRANYLVSPLLAPSLTGLPPTFVITAEYDPLRDEGEALVEALSNAGTTVHHTRFPGVNHGFFSLSERIERTTVARTAAADFLAAPMDQ